VFTAVKDKINEEEKKRAKTHQELDHHDVSILSSVSIDNNDRSKRSGNQ
jgi:hypothetical protein